VLYLKDILPYALRDDLSESAGTILRQAYHVPESLAADDLLRQLQTQRLTMAIARDEYGGTAGLVTTEDLLEEIVGDIRTSTTRRTRRSCRRGKGSSCATPG